MSNLRLPLKKKWFDMTDIGIKTEDYREMTPYWFARLCLWNGRKLSQADWAKVLQLTNPLSHGMMTFRVFDTTTLTLGYPSKEDTGKIITFEHLETYFGRGNEEWGANKDEWVFIIKHGRKL